MGPVCNWLPIYGMSNLAHFAIKKQNFLTVYSWQTHKCLLYGIEFGQNEFLVMLYYVHRDFYSVRSCDLGHPLNLVSFSLSRDFRRETAPKQETCIILTENNNSFGKHTRVHGNHRRN